MATNETEKKNVTGLDNAANRKEAEYDLVSSLLAAANFQTDDDQITEVEIKRAGKFMFAFHIHPISDTDARFARKKATKMMPNPNNKKLPPIEKEFDNSIFGSWLIYLATTEEDKAKIWGNPQVMAAKGLMEAWESVNVLLTMGEKKRVLDLVTKISGMDDDDDEEVVSEEEFL